MDRGAKNKPGNRRIGTPPKKPKTIGEWYDLAPSGRVTRADLMMVLEGFNFLPAEQVGQLIQNAIVLERERKWYRRLWRWVKATMWQKKKLEDLSPEARQKVRAELDRADQAQADGTIVTSPGVAKQIEEATDG